MQEHAVSTKQILQALWKRKWVLAICAVIGVAIAVGIVALCMPAYYEATTVFLLKGPEPNVLTESSIYILQSRKTLDAILNEAGHLCDRDALANMLEGRILGTTPMLEVTVSCENAETAKHLADAVTKVLPQRLMQLIEGVSVEIVDAPELPAKPQDPHFVLAALVGLLCGIALPICVVTAREYWKIAV